MTGIWGALVEAWEELRIHKLRVMLSLIGVAVSVLAMTSVTAAGQMLLTVSEQLNASSGRPATYYINAYATAGEGTPEETAEGQRLLEDFFDRYDVEGVTRSSYATLPLVIDGYLADIPTQTVDQNWREIAGFALADGRWFAPGDEEMFAPPLIVNSILLHQLGHETWTGPFTAKVQGSRPTTVTVIGTYSEQWEGAEPSAYMLIDSYTAWVATPQESEQAYVDNRVWIDPALAAEFEARLTTEIRDVSGGAYDVSYGRQDVFGSDDFLDTLTLVVTGIGLLILGLSALNLLNISIVTLRQRIREIGVRRALGASSTRVFFSILLESVVATAAAGFIGVVLSIVILRNIPIEVIFGTGIPGLQTPAYPISAAVTGLVASIVVGALAGLVPALMAVRIRPIEAIRY